MLCRALLVCVLAGCGLACGSKPAAPITPGGASATAKLPDGPPLVTPGERMSYRLQIGGIDLATYDIGVGDITTLDGRRAIVVQSHAKSKPLVSMVRDIDQTFTSWIDVTTGRPLRWTAEDRNVEGAITEGTDAHFSERSENAIPVDVQLLDQPALHEVQKVTLPEIWDYNALVVALRAWEAKKGSTTTAEVMRGRYLWHVTMTVVGEEKVVTDMGEFPALRFDGLSYMLRRDGTRFPDPERNFSLWISNDDGRVPLQNVAQSDYGDIKMTLVDYQPGNGSRLRP